MNEEAKNWMKRAKKDFEAAEKNADMDEEQVAMFLLQQSAEKALKSLQIQREGELQYTHDLVRLYRDLDISEQFRDLLEELNPAYTATRYPDMEPLEVDEVDPFIEEVEQLLKWIRQQLKK